MKFLKNFLFYGQIKDFTLIKKKNNKIKGNKFIFVLSIIAQLKIYNETNVNPSPKNSHR